MGIGINKFMVIFLGPMIKRICFGIHINEYFNPIFHLKHLFEEAIAF
jgi:hypothetical protein